MLQAWEKRASGAVIFFLDTVVKASMISFWWLIFGALFWHIFH